MASNSWHSKCTILKSVSKEHSLQGIWNARSHAETLQLYLLLEDNVLISTRRGDWFQWVHLGSSSLFIAQAYTTCCGFSVQCWEECAELSWAVKSWKSGVIWGVPGLADVFCKVGRSVPFCKEQLRTGRIPCALHPTASAAVAGSGTNTVGFPQYTKNIWLCHVYDPCKMHKVILH